MLDMKILLLLALISLLSTKNVIIIGDSRTCMFAQETLGFEYSSPSTQKHGKYIIGEKAKYFEGHWIQDIAQSGATFDTFQGEGIMKNAVDKILRTAQSGTVGLLFLGVNDLDVEKAYNYYVSLAEQCEQCKFYVVSVVGVAPKWEQTHSSRAANNEKIKRFNVELKKKIRALNRKNLGYKNINHNRNPSKIINTDTNTITYRVKDSTTTIDGLHFNKEGGREILKAMLTKI